MNTHICVRVQHGTEAYDEAVAAEFEGEGVGLALVDFAESFARDLGFGEVVPAS